jgi:hypothetical protein
MRNASLLRLAVILPLTLLVGACSRSGGENANGNPLAIGGISADNAEMLARSALNMISEVIAMGNIATDMIELGTPIVGASGTSIAADHNLVVPIPPPSSSHPDGCPGNGVEFNQISYLSFDPGFQLPPGDVLHVPLGGCQLEGVLVQDGFMDIAAVEVTNDRSALPQGPWTYEGVVSLGPIDLEYGNDTRASLTNKIGYSAQMAAGVLTTRLAIARDPDPGIPDIQGGLNAQHVLGSLTVNYQLRPFYIVTEEDGNDGSYRVDIGRNPDNQDSLLDRYTSSPNAEVILRVTTLDPVTWAGGRPSALTDLPTSGTVELAQTNCNSCGSSIRVTVTSEGVTMVVNYSGGTVTRDVDWATLLSPPDPV